MEGRSKLFIKARETYLERPNIVNHILKRKNFFLNNINNINKIEINNKNNKSISINETENENKKNFLVNINNKSFHDDKIDNSIIENKNNSPLILPNINDYKSIINNIKQIKQKSNFTNIEQFNINNNKHIKIKKEYNKENVLYTIIIFLDSTTLKNFMLSCKKFYNICKNYDSIWFNYYNKKFNNNNNNYKINYNSNKGNWYNAFINVMKNNTNRNYNNIKKRFFNQNKKYYNKKDVYFLIKNIYKYLKPFFYLIIDETIKIDIFNSFENSNNSHINFHINLENNNNKIDLNNLFNLSIFFNEKNIGIFDKKIYNNNIKEKKFKNYNNNNNFNIYYNNEIIFAIKNEEENKNILFINISLPICIIIEKIFDYIKNIHYKNNKKQILDINLYDYSLLINLKNTNQIFYTININTLDFVEEEIDDYLYYKNDSFIINNNDIKFYINENNFLENFLIMDIILLNSNGIHLLCDSKILILFKDENNNDVDYNNYYCDKYLGIIKDKKYYIKFKFNINLEENYFALVFFELKIKNNLIKK